MHRIDTPTAQVDKFGQGKNGFTNGDPATGRRATDLNSDMWDAVQEEVCAVIEQSGLTLDKSQHDQLYKGIMQLIAKQIPDALLKKNNLSDVIDKALARANLELGSAARNNTGDFISSGGGNYPAYLRMTGIETLPTEPAAANLSSLYSAPAPIPANVIVSGGVSNWYNYQAMWGLKRDASNGIQGWAVQINGLDKFKIDLSGNAYANNQKLATEAYAKNYADTTFVPLTRKVNNKALNSDISLSAADVWAISSQGGNYPAYLRMTGIETLPTEPSAANLSALYSAPSPIQPGSIAAGGVANWYNYQAMWGLIRNASTGITGWGVQINGAMRFTVGPDGSLYSNSDKVATESFILQNFVQDIILGAEITVPTPHDGRLPAGYVCVAVQNEQGTIVNIMGCPIQKKVNGNYYTVQKL